MKRSKKMVLVAHCLLNTNAKVLGISTVEGATPIIEQFIRKGYGIIQLPCIEMAMFGSQRWGIVYDQCDFPNFREKCRELLLPIVDQVQDYMNKGYEIAGIVGVDGSPTCAVNITVSGAWGGELSGDTTYLNSIQSLEKRRGMGVMMEELNFLLKDRDLKIPFYALDEEDMSSGKEILNFF